VRIPPDVVHRSSHLLAATLISWWLSTTQSSGQTHDVIFGRVQRVPLPGRYEQFLLLVRHPPSTHVLLAHPGSRRLAVVTIDSTCHVQSTSELSVPFAFDQMLSEDIDGDGRKDVVLISEREKRLWRINFPIRDSVQGSTLLTTLVSPTNLLIGDINNDRRPDVLVFDRETPGIYPSLGTGRGGFREGKVIYPDTPVGDATLAHLNNDGLLDLIVYDWVRSEIHLLYGVGQGKFLDQSAIPVRGELKKLVARTLTARGQLDLLLSLQQPARIEVLHGDGLGDFRLRESIPLDRQTASISLVDLFGKGFPDLIRLTKPSSLQVFYNTGEQFITPPVELAAPADIQTVDFADIDGDSLADALLLDRDGKQLLIYRSAENAHALRDSLEFVTGMRPRGVVVADIDADGWNDIALVNAGSNTLSVYFNRGWGAFAGQVTFALAENPRYLGYHSTVDSVARFLVSYPQQAQVSYFTLDLRDRSTVNYVIPTGGDAELLSWDTSQPNVVQFFCYTASGTTTTPALSYFQQLGPQSFIERNFRLTIPNALLGATVTDLNRDGRLDVAYLFRNAAGRYEFAVSLGDSLMSFRQKIFSYEMPEKQIQKSYFWNADFDGDGFEDVLLSFPLVTKVLKLVRGKGDGTFFPSDTLALDVQIADRSQLQVGDFDGDRRIDILWNDSGKNVLGWMRGAGHGTFESFRLIMPVPRLSHFAVGDIDGDGIADLVVTATEKGSVKLYNGRMFFRPVIQ